LAANEPLNIEPEQGFEFAGLLAFEDPVRNGAWIQPVDATH
jgi:magnesium-transporting ATPase (P-type)